MPGYARSLKSGEPENTTTSRAVIFEATAANSAPTTSDKQMVGMGTFSAVDLVLQCTVGGGSFDAKVWWWYEAVGAWVLDTAIGTVSMTTVIGTKRVAIVTSAWHLPRALALARRFGLAADGIPADRRGRMPPASPAFLVPDGAALHDTQLWCTETIGRMVGR